MRVSDEFCKELIECGAFYAFDHIPSEEEVIHAKVAVVTELIESILSGKWIYRGTEASYGTEASATLGVKILVYPSEEEPPPVPFPHMLVEGITPDPINAEG